MGKKASKKPDSYDLWESKDEKPIEDEGHIHYLRQTGKVKPKFKNEYVHSILPSVEAPKAGASYNPSLDDYLNYAHTIAKEEDAEIQKEERVKRALQLKPGESYCTKEDLQLEEVMGFFESSDDEDVKDIKTEDEIKVEDGLPQICKSVPKQKTMKQRKREQQLRLEAQERLKQKQAKAKIADAFRFKSLLKQIKQTSEEQEERVVERRRKRVLHRLVSTKRLGHGKYEEYKEPVLLPNEIKGNMLSLKPQGSILKERMKSLQKRNMLQPKSSKKQKQLKASLKFKVVDGREARDFMQQERAKLKKKISKK